jgi:aspartyl-tRNA(Asn)/glutamyl-tRNA(Gln) amidotransferase subunit A
VNLTAPFDVRTIVEAGQLIRRKVLTPVELVSSHLQRAETLNPKLNAFLLLTADEALSQAREAEEEIVAGGYRGPLHGVPVSLKDLYYTKGIRTTAGSRILEHFVPTYDATAWARLRHAGAVLLGKTNMYEFARGASATKGNAFVGAARNPWDSSRIPGGSSDGSAVAVVTRMGLASLGSDTAGSVRVPSALCGVVGLRPTRGLISRYGVVPLSATLDTCGPMTRTAEDLAIVLNAIAGRDAKDPVTVKTSRPDYVRALKADVQGLRMGIPREHFFENLHPAVDAAVRKVIAVLHQLGAEPVDVSVPAARDGPYASKMIFLSEGAAFHAEWLRERPSEYSEPVRRSLQEASFITQQEVQDARRISSRIADEFHRALEACDFVITPTVAVPAPTFAEMDAAGRDAAGNGEAIDAAASKSEAIDAITRMTRPVSLIGLPCLSVPCGFTVDGLPLAFQIVGRAFHESTLLAVAHAYQTATDWHRRLPEVSEDR